jgi:hypothetical protein
MLQVLEDEFLPARSGELSAIESLQTYVGREPSEGSFVVLPHARSQGDSGSFGEAI